MIHLRIDRPTKDIAEAHVNVRAYINYLEALHQALSEQRSQEASERGWEASRQHAERTGGWM